MSILTHEMTHAVVAQLSSDRAPRWLQEGIAERMELLERQENIFQQKPGSLVPGDLAAAVISGASATAPRARSRR